MKQQFTKYYIVLILLFLFAAPGITAYLFYAHPSWLGATRTNKGNLLANPIELTSLAGTNKWQLVFWTPVSCEQECLKQLDILARVRLALGRKLYQVEQKLLVGSMQAEQIEALKHELKAKDIAIESLSNRDEQQVQQLAATSQIFIINPDRYLILSYPAGANPDDVYKDLKLLLNTTETKG